MHEMIFIEIIMLTNNIIKPKNFYFSLYVVVGILI